MDLPQDRPSGGRFAFVYKAALAKNARSEAVYFPTMYVIPSATKAFGPADVQLAAHGFSLAMEALRTIDPEIGAMNITPLGETGFGTFDDGGDPVPALRKGGWRVFIDWGI